MKRALEATEISPSCRIFPGEGHGLGKNPWHGCIKLREELKWLEMQGGTQAISSVGEAAPVDSKSRRALLSIL